MTEAPCNHEELPEALDELSAAGGEQLREFVSRASASPGDGSEVAPIEASYNGRMLTVNGVERRVDDLQIAALDVLSRYPGARIFTVSLAAEVQQLRESDHTAVPKGRMGRAVRHLALFVNEAAGVEVIDMGIGVANKNPMYVRLAYPVVLHDRTEQDQDGHEGFQNPDNSSGSTAGETTPATGRGVSALAEAPISLARRATIDLHDRIAHASLGIDAQGGPAEMEQEQSIARQLRTLPEIVHEALLMERIAAAFDIPLRPENFVEAADMKAYRVAALARVNMHLWSAYQAELLKPGTVAVIALRLGLPPDMTVLKTLDLSGSRNRTVTYPQLHKTHYKQGGDRSFKSIGLLFKQHATIISKTYDKGIDDLRQNITKSRRRR